MVFATLFFIFFFLFHHQAYSRCPPSFNCTNLNAVIEFPLTTHTQPGCGLFTVDCNSEPPTIEFVSGGKTYVILEKTSSNSFKIFDPVLEDQLRRRDCSSFANLPYSPSCSLTISSNLTFFKCMNESSSDRVDQYFQSYQPVSCALSTTGFYRESTDGLSSGEGLTVPPSCTKIELPRNSSRGMGDLYELVTAEYTVEWNVYDDCTRCHRDGGQCSSTNGNNQFVCRRGNNHRTIILATVLSGAGVFIICLSTFLIIWKRRNRVISSYLLSRNISSEPSSKSEESGSLYYGIPIFSDVELEEATNNFDATRELGEGAFGTVYHGILKDGREVAIKRFYEHNYRRVEHFLNEIKVLTCLKHPNLVTLYGCTPRRSQLLLVYEYIQNGTVADHLHGDKAKESPLSWDLRMRIAIETASALSYLHKSDIVHRDVKTNNILLDTSFHVKVADFGLSRLFPNDVTHISTAPQGTPGYVDPDYHQCYQLTDKSDVYSFGVVLIELISSMPAVDITRRRREINLANLALDRIQRCAFDELIDSSLGYKSDPDVTRMTTTVAELAFRCLQLEKDMRPTMDEVQNILREIQSGEEVRLGGGPSPEMDDVALLKNKIFRPSPDSVTTGWDSGSTTRSSIV